MEYDKGLDLSIVVEEKRLLIEVQVREELYGSAIQPVCIGKKDERGEWLFPVKAALDPTNIAVAVGERLLQRGHNEAIAARCYARVYGMIAFSPATFLDPGIVSAFSEPVPHPWPDLPDPEPPEAEDARATVATLLLHERERRLEREQRG